MWRRLSLCATKIRSIFASLLSTNFPFTSPSGMRLLSRTKGSASNLRPTVLIWDSGIPNPLTGRFFTVAARGWTDRHDWPDRHPPPSSPFDTVGFERKPATHALLHGSFCFYVQRQHCRIVTATPSEYTLSEAMIERINHSRTNERRARRLIDGSDGINRVSSGVDVDSSVGFCVVSPCRLLGRTFWYAGFRFLG